MLGEGLDFPPAVGLLRRFPFLSFLLEKDLEAAAGGAEKGFLGGSLAFLGGLGVEAVVRAIERRRLRLSAILRLVVAASSWIADSRAAGSLDSRPPKS